MKVRIDGSRLVLARYEKGYNVNTLSKMIGVSVMTINNAESGRDKKISPVTMKKICDALDLRVSDVVSVVPDSA